MRLLLVEDDELLGDGIQSGLKQGGYEADWVTDGTSATAAIDEGDYDIIVLDIILPGRSGLEVLKHMRGKGDHTPVLLLTALDTLENKVAGLDAGADDYMIKPFDLDELFARLRALLRRRNGRSAPTIRYKNVILDTDSHSITRDNRLVDVSPTEFAILQLLLENIGKVQSRARLEESLYACGQEVESNVIQVHVHHLRRKLGDRLIRTVRGVGYIIDRSDE